MQTRVLPVTPENLTAISEAGATVIRSGGLVAFPTETVYGLGANALDSEPVRRVFTAKDRAADNPLIVHIAKPADLELIVSEIPEVADKLMSAFWPGPISLLMKKHPNVSDTVTSGLDTVVVRMPSHPVARELIKASGVPIAAPSANRSGRVSPTTAEHVKEDLDGRVEIIIDGGPVEFGLESTVIDCTTQPPCILRPGSISEDQIRAVIGRVGVPTRHEKPRSPGMKYRHYSPTAELTLIEANEGNFSAALARYLDNQPPANRSVISHSGSMDPTTNHYRLPSNPEAAAPLLFETIRRADERSIEEIIIEGWPEAGVGAAIMDRLRKAATRVIS